MSNQELKRLVVMIPEDKYEELRQIAEARYKSMSGICRDLIIEWIDTQKSERESGK